MKLGIKSVAAALLAALVLAGCGQKEESKVLKVGAIAGAESELVETAARVAQEKYGLQVEVVTFSDYVTPNVALNDGSIDLNAFQHKPYLDAQVKDRGFKLVPVGNTFVYPIAGYSKKIKSLDELKEGAQVAVPNDPTNLGRSLILLAKQGLLTLKDNGNLNATVLDIVANPKNLKIVELEAAQLPRSLEDVDLAIINTTFASQIDLTPNRDGLFVEDKESPYVNLIVARESNKDEQKVKEFVQSFQTDEVYKKGDELFKGGLVKGW
ncbi:methionine ABC transporter substrate-binding lipoprotein MetQ [Aeromonas schubertii]|uniref:Lipoprotein n=1 Tax=Aeromonas schubertii TaxID=652 RepID=A0ABS7VD54_9GAMM|nr:methionine ABC transporter substrate-binding lipoprotein MetQ [Aeromonas schubertii]MBZ6067314.1 methionine ABC transporter substrate-binding lipoprotein MetQ [Aeromonas schubertii]MBZ6070823.1 methionine ABC transporter substrate-binding lipoprotein MetQ [Aeromonas schubertii]